MNAINWLLINAGLAARWLGGALSDFFSWLGGLLYAILNPLLAPLLAWLNPLFTSAGNALYTLLDPLPPWLGLTLISTICGALMLIAFRYLSNQDAIGRARDQISANLFALKLFKEDIGVSFRCQGRLAVALLRWQWHMLRPMLLLIILLLPVFAQMGLRYQWRPLQPGEESLIRVEVDEAAMRTLNVQLEPNPGLAETIGPVPGGNEFVWRVRAGEPGRHTLQFKVDGTLIEKDLIVGEPFQRVSAERPGHEWTAQVLHPAEPPLPTDCPLHSIEIEYAGVESYIYGANWWILYFFIISMIAALLLLPFYKVRF